MKNHAGMITFSKCGCQAQIIFDDKVSDSQEYCSPKEAQKFHDALIEEQLDKLRTLRSDVNVRSADKYSQLKDWYNILLAEADRRIKELKIKASATELNSEDYQTELSKIKNQTINLLYINPDPQPIPYICLEHKSLGHTKIRYNLLQEENKIKDNNKDKEE